MNPNASLVHRHIQKAPGAWESSSSALFISIRAVNERCRSLAESLPSLQHGGHAEAVTKAQGNSWNLGRKSGGKDGLSTLSAAQKASISGQISHRYIPDIALLKCGSH